MWGPDVPHVDPNIALRHFTIVASGFVTFALMCKYILTPEMPAIRREYPFDGLVKELGGLEENKVRPVCLVVVIYQLMVDLATRGEPGRRRVNRLGFHIYHSTRYGNHIFLLLA